MKGQFFLFINVAVLPLILIIGGFTPISIFLFWLSSFIISIYYFKPIMKQCGAVFLLSPCIITYFYSILNYLTGSLYYCTNFLCLTRLYEEFFNIKHVRLFFILAFLNICNSLVAYIGAKHRVPLTSESLHKKAPFNVLGIFILLLFFSLLHVFIFDLSVIGGSAKGSQLTETGTGMNYPFILGIVVLLVHKLNTYRTPLLLHIVLLTVIILVMAVDSVGSKRELFFIIISILIIELIFHDKRIRLSLRNFLSVCLIGFVSVFYILSASIARGYGSLGTDDITESIYLVSEYAGNDAFNEMVGNNFETPYHYATAVISCDYTLTKKTPVLLGETFIKVLFIPIPRSIYKPRKMIDVFTTAYDAQKRMEGVSYPVSVYSELFANFHVFSIFFLYVLFLVFQKIYIRMVRNARMYSSFYIYWVPTSALFLQFVRGSGLESLIIYSILACSSIFVGKLLIGDWGGEINN